MVLLMVGAVNLTVWTMQQQDKVTQTLITKAASNLNKLNEKIGISDIGYVNNKLNITVTNSGGAVAQLASIYIINQTAATPTQYRYDLGNLNLAGTASVTNIGQSLAFTPRTDTNYSIKVVTAAGNSAVVNIASLSNTAMKITMFAIPSTIAPGANATILMAVTNNNTGFMIANPISAKMSYSTNCVPTASYTCSIQLLKTEGNGTKIAAGGTVFYKWVYSIIAPDNTPYTFTGSIVNGKSGNTATATVTVRLLDAGKSTSSTTTDVLSLKFLNNVGISLMVPGPFGTQSGSQAVWGVVVSNPTSQTLGVSRVSISTISPAGSSADNVISSGCTFTTILPASGTWSCPAANIVQWQAPSGSPVNIAGFQSNAFLVAINTGNINSPTIPAAVVTATAFTTYGQFSKTGYATNVAKTGSTMTNVFVTNNANSTNFSDVQALRNSVPSGSTQTFKVELVDYENTANFKINSGANLIINLPPFWTNVNICASCYGGFSTPTVTSFSDGSSQIKATRTSDITGTGSAVAGTITFTVTVPTVTDKRIYMMTLTSDGTVNSPAGFNLGATDEFPIQVDP